jgi:dihydrofolate reductase
MWNLITLDGYFEGTKNWELPWHEQVWGEELERFSLDQLQSADMLVFGRVTYEGMAAYWQTARGAIADYMNSLPKVVCSRTLQAADWNNTLVKHDAAKELAKLKQQGNGNMFVFGSANLSKTLMDERLFDEYRLGIAPVIYGNGRLLFSGGLSRPHWLRLVESRELSTGCLIHRYQSGPTA